MSWRPRFDCGTLSTSNAQWLNILIDIINLKTSSVPKGNIPLPRPPKQGNTLTAATTEANRRVYTDTQHNSWRPETSSASPRPGLAHSGGVPETMATAVERTEHKKGSVHGSRIRKLPVSNAVDMLPFLTSRVLTRKEQLDEENQMPTDSSYDDLPLTRNNTARVHSIDINILESLLSDSFQEMKLPKVLHGVALSQVVIEWGQVFELLKPRFNSFLSEDMLNE